MDIRSLSSFKKKYRDSIKNPKKYWADAAKENLDFFQPWKKVLRFENYLAQWFEGGLLNVSHNCLDRHIIRGNKYKIALIWEGEDGECKKFTYEDLHKSVCQFSNALENLGVKTGDCIAIYMPLIPEAVIAMLSCARIGATHTVIFGGFAAEALSDRINDCNAKILITADGGFRKGTIIPLKEIADKACLSAATIEKVIVVNRIKNKKDQISITPNRDLFWDDMISNQTALHHAKPLPSEHPLFMLYTSGTTGKPKGLVHTTAGYLLGAHMSTKWIFECRKSDILWTTADIGWITGHTYVVYGPLSNGGTVFMYEGAPLHPHPGRFWEMIERHKISILYTAPTAIRTFVKYGREWPDKYDLSSLRLLGTVGEPISPETWEWYHDVIGHGRSPIVDTWWQTETGSIQIANIPHWTTSKPGSAGLPFFAIEPLILDEKGHKVTKNHKGFLCIKKPWPSMARTIFRDHERYKKTYWQQIDGVYFTGDGAYCDKDDYFWVTGRIDDVLNVSGHRLSTVEMENAILSNHEVVECAVVATLDEIKGQAPVAFIMLRSGVKFSPELKKTIQKTVETHIGHFARIDQIHFVQNFPKTRSGKMMRRLLREFAQTGAISGDITTLEDFSALETFKKSGV